jgi:N-acetylneuraminic acid mutarotase
VGDKNTKARLTAINDYSYRIEADTNGDDTYDYNSGVLIWPGATPPPPQPWQERASMPTPRYSLAAGAVGEKIYAIGGNSTSTEDYLNTVEEYSPFSNTWMTKNPMLTARSYFVVGVVNGKIYAIGGRTFDPNTFTFPELNSVEEYDPTSNTWVTKSPMTTARWNFAAAVVNGKIYVFGGQSGLSLTPTVEEYNPTTDTWAIKASMPSARRAMAASAVNGQIYVIGGENIFNEKTNVVEEYDPVKDIWATKANAPTVRDYLVSESVNEEIFVFGMNSTLTSNVVEKFNPINDEWTLKTPMPEDSSGNTASVVNNKIYVIGIGNFSKVYEYNPALDQ